VFGLGGFDELVDQAGGGDLAHGAALVAGRGAERDERCDLPMPESPSRAQRFGAGDQAAGKGGQHRGRDLGVAVVSKASRVAMREKWASLTRE
jgi:hypothetical protein